MQDDRYPLAGFEDAPAAGVSAQPKFPAIEESVLRFWAADGTFQASIDARDGGADGSNEFVFYDGPPFANGLPHYGHLLTGYVKDVVPRYRTMRGNKVERRFGWDTHGLPAELEAMRLNGIKTTDEILELGIEKFNEACRESVMKYTGDWREYVTRQARWVDFDNDYRTMNPDYMESVIWAFKSLHDKGLVYEGFRVLPYCWNDETPLSNHELRMDDEVYRMRQDPAVTVGLEVAADESLGDDDPLAGVRALVWTTTPWTLPSNLAIMVGADIEYVVVQAPIPGRADSTARYLLAESRLAAYARELGEEPAVVSRYLGSELVGRHYTPPFAYYLGHENAFRIVAAEFVTTTDGTGLVHTAGAFGEDDKVVTDREGIEPVMPVGKDGRFTVPVVEYEGMLVFDANAHVIDDLKATTRSGQVAGSVTPGTVLLRQETYDHSYPHCWRCREPLIYKGVSSWFVKVTAIKERMLALNEQINWVPAHIKDGQFGKWLENARDWSITRNRFWGSPVPVWKSDDPAYPRLDVYGSFAELERDFGAVPQDRDGNPDLHRPFVDDLTRPNPDDPTGRSTMRRVADVLDVWFDSGSMSYAQVHYPFENGDWFENHFPADFIVEYIGQTRGWFYTLHILASALFDRPAFSTCISHGIVLGNDGLKMSKSLNNYPDVREVFDRDGADAMRWFLMSSPILRGGNLVVTEEGIREGVRQAQLPLWNAWYFLSLYAGAAGRVGQWRTDSTDVLDRYLLAKTGDLSREVETLLDTYDIAGACASIRSYLEALTNWYVRRSRQRFWDGDVDAIDTLHTVLEVVSRIAAPLLPLTTEAIWRGLTGGRSVHLADWPAADLLPSDPALVSAMDQVRTVCSAALSVRKAEKLRVRQPLQSLTVAVADPAALQPFRALIAEEVNVREVELTELAEGDARVQRKLAVNARAAGPRLGKNVQLAIKGSKSGDWSIGDGVDGELGVVTSGGLALQEGEYVLELVAGDQLAEGAALAVLPGGGFVSIDTRLTDALRADGAVADLLRLVQQARKDAGLQVSDRIALTLEVDDEFWPDVEDRIATVKAETLALQVVRGAVPGGVTGTVGDGSRKVGVHVAVLDAADVSDAVSAVLTRAEEID